VGIGARLYLPIDPDPTRPTVAAQEHDPGSTLNLVRRLIGLRRATPALGARAATHVLHDGYPFAYRRAESHLVVVNPRREPATITLDGLCNPEPVFASGVSVDGSTVSAAGFGYGIFALADRSGVVR
jgi:maltose alpha-D-glucosyltransferase/alpha-amylase